MNRWTRIAAALVLSLVVCGVVQHAALAVIGEFDRGWLYTGEALIRECSHRSPSRWRW